MSNDAVYYDLLPTVLHMPNWGMEVKYDGWTANCYSVQHKYGMELVIEKMNPVDRMVHSVFVAVIKIAMLDELKLTDNSDMAWHYGDEIFTIIRDNPVLVGGKFRDSIRYSGMDFAIEYSDKLDGDRVAELDFAHCKISLLNDYPEEKRLESLWHELYHLVTRKMTYEFDSSQHEEIFCCTMSLFTVWFLRNNDCRFLLF